MGQEPETQFICSKLFCDLRTGSPVKLHSGVPSYLLTGTAKHQENSWQKS